MSSLLPIGQFVQLTGLSARMVRFYEKLGILLPTKVELHNSYRYYDYEQTMQAEKIRLLRSLDMPLEDIKQLLDETDPTKIRLRLQEHRQYIEDKIASYRRALAALEILENNQGDLYPVVVKQIPEQTFLSIQRAVPLAQVDTVRANSLQQLEHYAHAHNQIPTGPGFAIIGTENEPPSESPNLDIHHYEFALPIQEPIPSSKQIICKQLPQHTVASTTHLGPYEPLHLAFRELNLWCHQQSRDYLHMLEIYEIGPLESDEPQHYRTEVQYVLEETR